MFENKNYHYGYMTERHFYSGCNSVVGRTKKDILNIDDGADLETAGDGTDYEETCDAAEEAADGKGGYVVYAYDEDDNLADIIDCTVYDDGFDFMTWTVDREPYDMSGWLYNTDKRAYFEALKDALVIRTDLEYEDVIADDTLDEVLGDIVGECLDEDGPVNNELTEQMRLHCLGTYGYYENDDGTFDEVSTKTYDDAYATEAFNDALRELGGVDYRLDKLFQKCLNIAEAAKSKGITPDYDCLFDE